MTLLVTVYIVTLQCQKRQRSFCSPSFHIDVIVGESLLELLNSAAQCPIFFAYFLVYASFLSSQELCRLGTRCWNLWPPEQHCSEVIGSTMTLMLRQRSCVREQKVMQCHKMADPSLNKWWLGKKNCK